MSPPRILLCGDVLGLLSQLYKRFQSVNKSAGPFDALLCVGQFFPDQPELLEEFLDFVEGRSEIPIPTYFVGDYGIGAAKILSAVSRSTEGIGFKMDGLEVCKNLYWLRGSGKFPLHGLSVAYLSGRHSTDGQFGKYNQDDVDALRALAEESGVVDLFLSNEWPSGITNRASQADISPRISGASGSDSTVAELVAEIKPRYHVVGSKGVFYAREPYINVDALHVTRFLGLASVGNKDKQKFIHAISPTPASTMSTSEISLKPPNTTLSPYTSTGQADDVMEVRKRTTDGISDPQHWRYDVPQKRQKHGAGEDDKLCFKFLSSGSCPRGEICYFRHDTEAREQYLRGVCFDFLNKGRCERGPDCNFKHTLQNDGETDSQNKHKSGIGNNNRSRECWFCLSNHNVESHLIISIGENFYCALPKGPLVSDHVLIIPIEHSPSTLSLPQASETELNRLQNSLKTYNQSHNKAVVFFELISKRGIHANLQVVPIPSSKAAALESIFCLAAEKLGFKFFTYKIQMQYQQPIASVSIDISSFLMKFVNNLDVEVTRRLSQSILKIGDARKALREEFDGKCSLFYVELPDGTILAHNLEDNERFPAQFGREVVAGLLNIAEKADWRKCELSKEEETELAEEFKQRFTEFDPNS